MSDEKPFRRGLGYIRDAPHKDAPLLLSRKQQAKLPASYMIIDGTGIEDQGNLGSCTGNAGDNAYKIRDMIATGSFVNGSRMQLYQCALAHDGNPMQDVGSSLSTMAWVLQEIGVAPEAVFPYTAQLGTPCNANVLAQAKKHEATKATRLDATNEATTIVNIKTAIVPNEVIGSSYPVMYGFTCYESVFSVGSDGNIPMPYSGEAIAGGHANVFIGYDDNHVNGSGRPNGALRTKNSWGTGWGDKGYGWLGYDYVLNPDDAMGDAWAIINTSDLPPTPPPASHVTFASTMDVKGMFVEGSDKTLWQQTGTTWTSLGGILTSAPSSCSRTAGIIDVFVRGNDSAVWWIGYANNAWGKWKSLGGKLLAGTGPTATAPDANTININAIGTTDKNGNNPHYLKRWTASAGWSGWTLVESYVK